MFFSLFPKHTSSLIFLFLFWRLSLGFFPFLLGGLGSRGFGLRDRLRGHAVALNMAPSW